MDTISGSVPHRLPENMGLTESRNGRAEMPQDWCARVAQLSLHAHLRLDVYAADCAAGYKDDEGEDNENRRHERGSEHSKQHEDGAFKDAKEVPRDARVNYDSGRSQPICGGPREISMGTYWLECRRCSER